MVTPEKIRSNFLLRPGFSLIELMAVIVGMSILLVSGISLIGDTGSRARRATTDSLSGLIEQGRTRAITTHSRVLLAIAEPKDFPNGDDRCRLALFKLKEFEQNTGKAKGELLRRWEIVTPGVALIAGDAGGFPNVMNGPQIDLAYTSGNKNLNISVHGIVFTPRGGREWPEGSEPVVFRIAEGGYRGSGKTAFANTRSDQKTISEDRLKIGRVIARPHRLDPYP